MNLSEAYKKLVAVTFDQIKGDGDLTMLLLRFYKQAFRETPSSICIKCIEGYYNRILKLNIQQIEEMELTRTAELKQGHNIYFNGNHYSNASITDAIAIAYLTETKNEELFTKLPEEYLLEKLKKSTVSKKISGKAKDTEQIVEVIETTENPE